MSIASVSGIASGLRPDVLNSNEDETKRLRIGKPYSCCYYQYKIKISDKNFLMFLSHRPVNEAEQDSLRHAVCGIENDNDGALTQESFQRIYSELLLTIFPCLTSIRYLPYAKWCLSFRNYSSPVLTDHGELLAEIKEYQSAVADYLATESGRTETTKAFISTEIKNFYFNDDRQQVHKNLSAVSNDVFNPKKIAEKLCERVLRAVNILYIVSMLSVTKRHICTSSLPDNNKRAATELFNAVLLHLRHSVTRESKSIAQYKQDAGLKEIIHINHKGIREVDYNGCLIIAMFFKYINLFRAYNFQAYFYTDVFLTEFIEIIGKLPRAKLVELNSVDGQLSNLLKKKGLTVDRLISEEIMKLFSVSMSSKVPKIRYYSDFKLKKMFKQYAGQLKKYPEKKVLYFAERADQELIDILMTQTAAIRVIFFGAIAPEFRSEPEKCKILKFSVKHLPQNCSSDNMYLVAFNHSSGQWTEATRLFPQELKSHT